MSEQEITGSQGRPVALVTGSGRRVGAGIARHLHERGFNVIIHYRQSAGDAAALCNELCSIRAASACTIQADLSRGWAVKALADQSLAWQARLDLLVNNASDFYPARLEVASDADWERLFASNAKAPYFLLQALLPALRERQGSVVNLLDAMVQRPANGFCLYTMAKSALMAMTRSLAKELAPDVRVNAVSPGAILWPEHEGDSPDSAVIQEQVVNAIPLGRTGTPEDIARAVAFFACDAPYVTGQLLAVDGGRSL